MSILGHIPEFQVSRYTRIIPRESVKDLSNLDISFLTLSFYGFLTFERKCDRIPFEVRHTGDIMFSYFGDYLNLYCNSKLRILTVQRRY